MLTIYYLLFSIYDVCVAKIEIKHACSQVNGYEVSSNLLVVFENLTNQNRLEYEEDPVTTYVREVQRWPLLKAEEEIQLAKVIKKGITAKRILSKFKNAPQRTKLEQLIVNGEEAKRTLVNCNLRLVTGIAKKYTDRGVPLLDLIQEGNIGLMHAADKFDYKLGNRFVTYAHFWIKQAVSRAIYNQQDGHRKPVHIHHEFATISKATRELTNDLGKYPTIEEISTRTGFSKNKIETVLNAMIRHRYLSETTGDGNNLELADTLIDTSQPMEIKDDELQTEEIIDLLYKILPDKKQAYVISRRFFHSSHEIQPTLQDIANEFRETREWIRQLENKGRKTLKRCVINPQTLEDLKLRSLIGSFAPWIFEKEENQKGC